MARELDTARDAGLSADEACAFEGEDHLVDGRYPLRALAPQRASTGQTILPFHQMATEQIPAKHRASLCPAADPLPQHQRISPAIGTQGHYSQGD